MTNYISSEYASARVRFLERVLLLREYWCKERKRRKHWAASFCETSYQTHDDGSVTIRMPRFTGREASTSIRFPADDFHHLNENAFAQVREAAALITRQETIRGFERKVETARKELMYAESELRAAQKRNKEKQRA